MADKEEIEKLAASLLKSGLASSEKDALDRASAMIDGNKVARPEEKHVEKKQGQTTIEEHSQEEEQ
tara:strand:+ start:284 stop:481 length:198 start_codon:yes stop_codon:yes gene_type:complete